MTNDQLHQTPATQTTPPPAVAAWLDGTALADKVGTVIGVLTTDADGWPHHAQLSAGEVLLDADGKVKILLHANSGTTDNIRRDGRIVLVLAADRANHELRFKVRERTAVEDPPRIAFAGHLVVARGHRVPYAEVVSGVRYTLHDTRAVLRRWQDQIDLLRSLDSNA